MANELQGMRIAFIATDGVEQVELTEPWKAVQHAGGEPHLLSIKQGEIQGMNHLDKGDTFPVDSLVSDADPTDYDGLVLPGGVANPDFLRMSEDAVSWIRDVLRAGQARRRHLPRPLDARRGRPRARSDADVVAVAPHGHPERRRHLGRPGVRRRPRSRPSRRPDDLPAFNAKIVEEFGEGVHAEQREAAKSAFRA